MNQEQTTEAEAESIEGDTDFERDVALLANQALDTIQQFVQERPHAALGLAAALGFVVGGGLTPRRLVRIGFAAGGPALTRQITSQLARIANEAWLQSESPATSAEGAHSPPGVRPRKPVRPRRPKTDKE